MADAKVQIGDSADFLEGTTVTTLAGADLFREGVVISDPDVAQARARITNTTPAADAYGLAVRVVGGVVVGSEVEIKNDAGSPIPVSGTVSVGNFPATQQVSGTVALDSASLAALESITVQNGAGAAAVNIQDGGNSITVDGSVAVNNFPATQAVSGTVTANAGTGTFNVAGSVSVNNTVSVSATDLDIRNLSSAQDSVTVTGSVSVSNFPATQAVSGTVTVTATDLDTRNLTAAQDNIRAFDSTDSEYLRVATSVTTAGDTTLVTPSAGKRIRLQWVYAINDPTASIATKLTIKLGSAVQYVAWAISKRQQLTGAVDAPLVINLSAAGDVAVTVFYQEV